MNQITQRNDQKAKKPTFIRQDGHKKKRLNNGWRRPKGLQSKMRLNKRGYRRSVRIGWGSPKVAYGLNKEGHKEIMINNVADLDKIKDEVALISSNVGKKNKIEIVKICIEKKIKISNLKDPEKFLKTIDEEKKKQSVDKKKREEEKKKKASEKKKDEKESLEKIADDKKDEDIEDKKKQEKKEKDKILTRKE